MQALLHYRGVGPCLRHWYIVVSALICVQLQDMRKNEDPRLSFSTPEFKEAQRVFTDNFKARALPCKRPPSPPEPSIKEGQEACLEAKLSSNKWPFERCAPHYRYGAPDPQCCAGDWLQLNPLSEAFYDKKLWSEVVLAFAIYGHPQAHFTPKPLRASQLNCSV